MLAALEERKARFHRTRQLLTDVRRTAFVFVVVPERLPILETDKAVGVLNKYEIPVGAILVNRVLPPEADGVFLSRRREREATYLERIKRTFDAYPIFSFPLCESDVVGIDALQRVAAIAAGG